MPGERRRILSLGFNTMTPKSADSQCHKFDKCMFASLPHLVGAIAVEDLNVGEDRAEEVLALLGDGGSDWPEGLKCSDRGENEPPLKGNKKI